MFGEREPQAKGGALAGVALQLDAAAVFAHDALHDHQAKAGALFLGGEIGLEDAVDFFLRNAAARVGHVNPHAIGLGQRGGRQCATVRHRLNGVFDEVHQRLLNLRGIERRYVDYVRMAASGAVPLASTVKLALLPRTMC